MPSAGGPDVLPRQDADAGGGGGGSVESYDLLHIVDQKAEGTAGGTFTAGSWQTHVLNTELVDEIGSTLSSNQFTLPAGTYDVVAHAVAVLVNNHKLRLRNITDGTTAIVGANAYGDSVTAGVTTAHLMGRFTIAGTKTFELQHRAQTTKATDGWGIAAFYSEVEVYASVFIKKVA